MRRLASGVVPVLVLTVAVPVAAWAQETVPNPGLDARCGLRVMLVLDESASIDATPNATVGVRNAANSFVTALEHTGSEVGITAFAGTARLGVPYQEVNQATIGTFRNWINNAPGTNGFLNPAGRFATNWQDAFLQVDRISGSHPDLVVFVTDGDPNTRNNPSGGTITDTSSAGVTAAVDAAVTAANELKRAPNPTHIFAIGVGAAVNNEASAMRLQRISGTNQFPAHSDFSTADFTLVTEFGGLTSSLTEIVARLCGSSLTITKFVADRDGVGFTEEPGWSFTATLDPTPGHRWLEPEGAGREASATATTTSDPATFHWVLDSGDDKATLRAIQETERPGFHFVRAKCQIHRGGTLVERVSATKIPGARLGREEFYTCEVYNAGPGAHLTVVKRLIPSTDPGRFDLLVGGIPRVEQVGDGGSTGRLRLGLGRHRIRERVTAAQADAITLDQYSIRTRCVNETTGREVAAGTGSRPVSVRLRNETDDVVCTITNRRRGQPPPEVTPPPGPVFPPPPCGDVDAGQPECGDLAAALPRLVISKRMSARARVGRLVPIRVTVRNVGRQTAERVRLQEIPPGGGRIVRVAGLRPTRRTDGTLGWSLGSLAPGASRTVRATMLVTRRGLLRNTTVADADNAGDVLDEARVRATRPPAPPVTG